MDKKSLCFINKPFYLPYDIENKILNYRKERLKEDEEIVKSKSTFYLLNELKNRFKLDISYEHKQYSTYKTNLLDISYCNTNSDISEHHELLNLLIYTKLNYSDLLLSLNVITKNDLLINLTEKINLLKQSTAKDIIDDKIIDFWMNIDNIQKKNIINEIYYNIKIVYENSLLNNRINNIGDICYDALRLKILNNKILILNN